MPLISRKEGDATILFVVNDPRFFVTHRLALAEGIKKAGYRVHVAVPTDGYARDAGTIRSAGIPVHNIPIARQGINPVRDIIAFVQLLRLYRRLRPDIAHHVTVKPVLYGSIAAQVLGVAGVVNAISGRGRLFANHSNPSRARAFLMRLIYRAALRHRRMITIFQNSDDQSMFIRARIVRREASVLIEGSGSELKLFNPLAEPEDPPIVLLPARILQQKGVREFIAAARILKADGTAARFAIVGDSAGNRDAVPIRELDAARNEGAIELWGWAEDISEVMRRAAIVCLPSYHEGLPKALTDACAAGRPIVATDIPGCRAVVINGVNGLLVPPRDANSLARALRLLISDRSMRKQMGRRSREIAVDKFDVDQVIKATLQVYEMLQGNH